MGSQSARPVVAGLPSVSPARIAVIGRQKLQASFESQHPISASADDMLSIPKSRAARVIDRPFAVAMSRNAAFMNTSGLAVKKCAISVCSGVRVVLSLAPSDLTSLNSAA
jgi:hypothetical protein